MKLVSILSTLLMMVPMLIIEASAASSETELQLLDGAHAYQSGDYANALSIFELLAESGNAQTQTILGTMYFEAHPNLVRISASPSFACDQLCKLSLGLGFGEVLFIA